MLCDLFMNKTLAPSRGSDIFMRDIMLYFNQSQIGSKLCYFDINQRNHILKTKVFTKYEKKS